MQVMRSDKTKRPNQLTPIEGTEVAPECSAIELLLATHNPAASNVAQPQDTMTRAQQLSYYVATKKTS